MFKPKEPAPQYTEADVAMRHAEADAAETAALAAEASASSRREAEEARKKKNSAYAMRTRAINAGLVRTHLWPAFKAIACLPGVKTTDPMFGTDMTTSPIFRFEVTRNDHLSKRILVEVCLRKVRACALDCRGTDAHGQSVYGMKDGEPISGDDFAKRVVTLIRLMGQTDTEGDYAFGDAGYIG